MLDDREGANAQSERLAEAEQQRADAEKRRADAEKERADAERQRADAEKRLAETEKARSEAEARATAESAARVLAEERLKTESERLTEAQAAAKRSENERLATEKQLAATRNVVTEAASKVADIRATPTSSESPPKDPTDAERQKLLFDIWSKAVDTQMHFNEMSTRSRALGLTFVVAALSLAVFLMTRGDAWALKPSLDKDHITTTNGALLYAGIIFFTICLWGTFPLEVNSVVEWLVRSGGPYQKPMAPGDAAPTAAKRSKWVRFALPKVVAAVVAINVATHWIAPDWGGLGVCGLIIVGAWAVLSELDTHLQSISDSKTVKNLVEWTRRFWFLRLLATIPIALTVSPWVYGTWKRLGVNTLHAVAICALVAGAWWFALGIAYRPILFLLPRDRFAARGRRLTKLLLVVAAIVAVLFGPRGEDHDIPLLSKSVQIHVSVILVLASAFALLLVKLLDLGVYHRMLRGAVTFGEDLEAKYIVKEILPLQPKGMTQAISHFSRHTHAKFEAEDNDPETGKLGRYLGTDKISAEAKVGLFYSRTFVLLGVTALVMFIAVNYRWDNPPANSSHGSGSQSSGSMVGTPPGSNAAARDAGIDGP